MPVLSIAILRRCGRRPAVAAAAAAAAASPTATPETDKPIFLAAAHNLSSFGWFTKSRFEGHTQKNTED